MANVHYKQAMGEAKTLLSDGHFKEALKSAKRAHGSTRIGSNEALSTPIPAGNIFAAIGQLTFVIGYMVTGPADFYRSVRAMNLGAKIHKQELKAQKRK